MKSLLGREQVAVFGGGQSPFVSSGDWFAFTEEARRVGDYRLTSFARDLFVNGSENSSEASASAGERIEYVPGLCLEQYEMPHRTAYGDTPRRISCETALAKTAFTPVLGCHVVNAPEPKSDTAGLDGRVLYHIYETEETLRLGSIRVGEFTWISSPARSLLDCGFYHCVNRVPDWIISAVRIANFRADEIVELSEQIGMQDGARRIASIASLLSEEDTDGRDWLSELAEYASLCAEDGNIWLDMLMPQNKVFWEDKQFGVLWNVPPKAVQRYCYR